MATLTAIIAVILAIIVVLVYIPIVLLVMLFMLIMMILIAVVTQLGGHRISVKVDDELVGHIVKFKFVPLKEDK